MNLERAIRDEDLDLTVIRQRRVLGRRRAPRRCVSGKRRYRDTRQTTECLHKIANMRAAAAIAGVETNRREYRSYECPHCSGRHLTSITAEVWTQRNERW